MVSHGDIIIELKREEENESYTVRDLLVTNNRVRKDLDQTSAQLCLIREWPRSLFVVLHMVNVVVDDVQENKTRLVRQFHFHGWPEVGIPTDGKGMINIIAAVQKQQQQSGNHPITVHCR